ncbi:hypothetical protein [Nocardia crassostreae]|uniref:hypothetical protein n=1 Tax=Nocardia crassostreae TaxID=53428 RepID=UPI0008323A67|nr:hypothetical protein [Nocardia crassostreae]
MVDTSTLPDGWTLEEIRQRADDNAVELLDPSTPVFLDASHPNQGAPLAVDLIIGFSSLCLARSVDHRNHYGDWFMGPRPGTGESILCWASYGADLGAAIDGL